MTDIHPIEPLGASTLGEAAAAALPRPDLSRDAARFAQCLNEASLAPAGTPDAALDFPSPAAIPQSAPDAALGLPQAAGLQAAGPAKDAHGPQDPQGAPGAPGTSLAGDAAPVESGAPAAQQTGMAGGMPNDPGAALSPLQLHTRMLKRRALGLDGGLRPQATSLGASASPQGHAAARGEDLAGGAAAMAMGGMPPQHSAGPSTAMQSPARTQPISVAASTAPGSAAVPSAMGAAAAGAVPMLPSDFLPETPADLVPTLAADLAPEPPAEIGPAMAPELAQAPPPPSEEGAQMPGALPAPLRQQRQEQIAQEIGAQVQAQALRIEQVNTRDTLPRELIKAL
jgi:hypothetical protein